MKCSSCGAFYDDKAVDHDTPECVGCHEETRAKRGNGSRVAPPAASTAGSRSPGELDAKPRRVKRGVPVCMTCGAKYDVEFIDRVPVFYDHGTHTKHRCK